MSADRFIRAVLVAGAALFGLAGAWAFLDPASFYERVALFPPYNRHLLHDVGAFQVGLGTGLALAAAAAGGRQVALWAAAAASALHALSHVLDRELGGRSTDPVALALIAAVLISAAVMASRPTTRPGEPAS